MQYGSIEHKRECYDKLKLLINETPQVIMTDIGSENKHVY